MRRIILTTIAVAALAGCKSSTTVVKAMDTIGFEKREMLKDRLQEARDAQVAAKQQLQSALYTLRRMDTVAPTEMADLHDDLESEVNKTEDEIDDLNDNIQSVESVAQVMFEDWQEDLAKYEDQQLRQKSQEELRQTQQNYNAMIAQLKSTHEKLVSLVPALKDQVLYVEHSINAGVKPQESEKLDDVREQVSSLIEELEGSIDRTQRFIEEETEVAA